MVNILGQNNTYKLSESSETLVSSLGQYRVSPVIYMYTVNYTCSSARDSVPMIVLSLFFCIILVHDD
jgi:hypothetical protein